MDETEDQSSAPLSVWLGLVLLTLVSFWAQAVTTEERFVPALNVITHHFKIPDDVAGATLIAAGASSPELFSNLVSLFITGSSLGLGTVIGSDIFNQLCICAGAVFAARDYTLYLDRTIVIREIFFYGLSVALLTYVLKDRRPLESDRDGPDHLFINFFDACLLVGGYFVYVILLTYYEQILSLFGLASDEKEESKAIYKHESIEEYGALKDEDPVIIVKGQSIVPHFIHEPMRNFHMQESMHAIFGQKQGEDKDTTSTFQSSGHSGAHRDSARKLSAHRASSHRSSGRSIGERTVSIKKSMLYMGQKLHLLSVHSDRSLIDEHEDDHMNDLPTSFQELDHISMHDDEMACFLWHRSKFYDQARVAVHAWQLRYCTFHDDRITSHSNQHVRHIKEKVHPRFDKIIVDEAHNVIKFVSVCDDTDTTSERVFMAPSGEVLRVVIERCRDLLSYWNTHEEEPTSEEQGEEDMEPRLIDFPYGAGYLETSLHILLYPIKALMHYTIPDVRCDERPNVCKAYVATVSCLIWLIVFSYFMVSSLETLADFLDIPDAIAGVTVSAAGTSLPNYVASQVAAKQGLGNMAVSNAFGSNIFNIMIGLGVPWMLYTAFVTKGEAYHDLEDDGIVLSVIILGLFLLAFIVLIVISKFVLYRWHAIVFYAMYALYVVGEAISSFLD